MSRELKPYPKYKDSGVEWIGEVPEEWEIKKVRNNAILNQQSINVDKLKNNVWRYFEIPTIQETGSYKIEYGDHIKSNKYILKGSEILVSKLNPRKGTVIKLQSNDNDLICSTELIPVQPKGINKTFLYYQFKNSVTADVFNSMVTSVTYSHQRINPKDIENFLIAMPGSQEQKTIGQYLDQKTSEIDALIADKEKLISLLEEKRQAVITETVTKGLDPNVKMKDSGIEWIGEIPEHWEVVKLKYIGKSIMGLLYSPKDICGENEGILVLRASNIQRGNIDTEREDNVYVSKEVNENLTTHKNDLLICARSGSRELIGKSAIIDEESAGNSFGAFTTVYRSVYNPFIRYVFQSGLFQSQIGTYLTSTINQLTMRNLNNLEIVLPPIEDQNEIQEKLDRYTENHKQAAKEIKQQISKLKQYRESLIYEAVTGKIDLRDYGEEAESLVAERGETYGN